MTLHTVRRRGSAPNGNASETTCNGSRQVILGPFFSPLKRHWGAPIHVHVHCRTSPCSSLFTRFCLCRSATRTAVFTNMTTTSDRHVQLSRSAQASSRAAPSARQLASRGFKRSLAPWIRALHVRAHAVAHGHPLGVGDHWGSSTRPRRRRRVIELARGRRGAMRSCIMIALTLKLYIKYSTVLIHGAQCNANSNPAPLSIDRELERVRSQLPRYVL